MTICERCGKEYEFDLNETADICVHISYPEIHQTGNIILLCPDCQEELITWIEKGINNGKA